MLAPIGTVDVQILKSRTAVLALMLRKKGWKLIQRPDMMIGVATGVMKATLRGEARLLDEREAVVAFIAMICTLVLVVVDLADGRL